MAIIHFLVLHRNNIFYCPNILTLKYIFIADSMYIVRYNMYVEKAVITVKEEKICENSETQKKMKFGLKKM